MDCLFCKIVSKEIPSEVILFEDEDVLAFLDLHPLTPGHTLVVPKNHFENIIELTPEKVGNLFLLVRKVTEALLKTLSPSGFTIGINHGKAAGQVIDHMHVHVIPRYENDGGKSIHSIVFVPTNEPLRELAERV